MTAVKEGRAMTERRSLVEGIRVPDPEVEKSFVYGTKPPDTPTEAALSSIPPQLAPRAVIDRLPISSRLRADMVTALKRASLERQLQGVEPSSLQEMMEEALEPWLKQHGYLP
jgi:hypothetical protein